MRRSFQIGLLLMPVGIFAAYAGFILGPAPKFGVGMAIDQEGNVYFAGGPDGFNTRFTAVTKYDKEGKQLWERRFGIRGASGGVCEGFAADYEGNVYVTGTIQKHKVEKSIYTTMKYAKNGKRLWQVSYKTPPKYCFEAIAIAVDTKADVHIVGLYELEDWTKYLDVNLNFNSEGDSKPTSDILTIKYDTNGRELWTKRHGRAENQRCEPGDIAVDRAGNVYITGRSWVDSNDGLEKLKFVTLKYNAEGKKLWVVLWPPSGERTSSLNRSNVLTLDKAGNVYVLGDSSHTQNEYTDMVTIKYDTDGNRKWMAQYRTSGKKLIFPKSIALGEAGTVCILGNEKPRTYGAGYPPNDTLDSMKKAEFITVKYDADGKELWRAKYKNPEGSVIITHYIVVGARGNVYVIGSVLLDALVIMYDSNGNEQWVRQLKDPSQLAKLIAEVKMQRATLSAESLRE
ncbi:MAG: hypothetical protein GWN67_09765 [Phycisphaerae bacterium]|nr:hypothetical protein [Phycisphaerae bacterium]NIP52378.1 hypothetical protein [Phycisphaerae bacterium]NIS51374.1 hypothetical protein [Phycisphaerae bacterium]NIU08989.1 hypothetical protein [Phycisphaerae bacterium]NIU56649.1 hypothetical protein [Phycisphaerae bacterium]